MRVLIAEDEEQIASAESAFLKLKGFEVDNAFNGLEAVKLASAGAYDVIVMDIMMPEMDGLTALKQIRASGDSTPVIMLTAKTELDDRIDGLEAGADDYLAKPFALRELEARVKAQIRRSEKFSSDTLTYRGLTMKIGEQELICRSSIRLAGKETALMEYLMKNPEKLLTADEIFSHVWKEQSGAVYDTVELYISYLTQKLGSVAADVMIVKENGGYKLCGNGAGE